MMQMQTMEEFGQMQNDFSVKRENIKQHHTAVKSARAQKKSLRDWFAAWQTFASEERDCRLRTENLRQVLKARQATKALRKWRLRTEKTQQMRAFLKRGKFVKRQLNLKTAYLAWKQ